MIIRLLIIIMLSDLELYTDILHTVGKHQPLVTRLASHPWWLWPILHLSYIQPLQHILWIQPTTILSLQSLTLNIQVTQFRPLSNNKQMKLPAKMYSYL